MIKRFDEYYRFLSNFYPSTVTYEGMIYPTVEHAYQAAKTNELSERERIQNADTPGQAKKLGRTVTLREDWEEIKLSVMRELLHQKFRAGSTLAVWLEQTGDQELQESNSWGDTFWGTSLSGRGKNHLGLMLMEIRKNNREDMAKED